MKVTVDGCRNHGHVVRLCMMLVATEVSAMLGSSWFMSAVVFVAGIVMIRPIWRTYTEAGLRSAARQLMWSLLAWLSIALLTTQPIRL